MRVVMPWDPGYGQVPGEGCEPGRDFPGHFTRRRASHTDAGAARAAPAETKGPGVRWTPGPRAAPRAAISVGVGYLRRRLPGHDVLDGALDRVARLLEQVLGLVHDGRR